MRKRLHVALYKVSTAVAVSMLLSEPGFAQDAYPNQPIKIIVPFSAAGGTDITARLLGEHLRGALGQSVIIDNRPGNAGMIGTRVVAKAAPDGYTLLVASGEMAVNPHLYKVMPYDWEKDLAPITNLVNVASVIVVNADVPARNVQELIAYAKANPKTVSYGSTGAGGMTHLGMELFNKMAGVQVNHVPYKGAAQQLADVAGRHVTMTLSSIGATLPLIEGGKVKAVAVTSIARVSTLPNVPAVAEYPPMAGYEFINFFGFYAPAGTPDPVMRKLNAAAVQAFRTPELGAKLRDLGFEPSPNTPEQFREFVRMKSKQFAKIIVDANVQIDQ
ncbi:MAG: Tat pathway signal protein [Betaproteobacteria bacterium]|nr:Tat pathway signal protein [Betaproteobacteria bacterium]